MSFKAILATNAVYKISNVVVLFLTTAILSRAMGVEGYGLLSLLLLNCSLFNLFTSFGTDAGITYSSALDSSAVSRVVSLALLVVLSQIVLLLFTEAISFGFSGHLWLSKGNDYTMWLLGLCLLISISLQEKFAAVLNGNHLYAQANKSILFSNFLSVVVIGLFFLLNSIDFHFYLLLFVASNLLQAILLIYVCTRYLPFSLRLSFSRRTVSLFFSYSFLAFFINCVQFLAYRIDFWFINYYRNETEVGLYALAVRLVQLFWILPLLFASIIFPKVSSASKTYDKTGLHALLRMMNVLNIVAGIFLFFAIKPIILLIFGRQYAASVPAFQILLPGILPFTYTIILAAYFAGMNALKVNLWGSLLCLLCIGSLDLILIPKSGYIGAAIASSIGYSLTSFYFILVYSKRTEHSFLQLLLPQKGDWKQLQSIGKSIFTKQV